MRYHKPLASAILQRRYQRFLADVQIAGADGEPFTIHCPNTGAMTGCAEPGYRVWYQTSDNPKRKYQHSWELTETDRGDFICVNTQRANQVAGEALTNGLFEEFYGAQLESEVGYGEQNAKGRYLSRIDWLATQADGSRCFIECKSVTLHAGAGIGMFPDTRSERAHKHLRTLMAQVAEGHQAMVLYVVMHSAIESVQAAAEIDPTYAELCNQASASGVRFKALKAQLSPTEIIPKQIIPVHFL